MDKLDLKTTHEVFQEQRPLTEVELDVMKKDMLQIIDLLALTKDKETKEFLSGLLTSYDMRILDAVKAKGLDMIKARARNAFGEC